MIHKTSINSNKFILNAIVLFCSATLLITAVTAYAPLNGEADIYTDLIRLHVLANSDTEKDQKLKYNVRDDILEYISALTTECKSSDEAQKIIQANLSAINDKVQESIKKHGYSYSSQAVLKREKYPTIDYNGDEPFSLPAGTYNSLRILIGNAEGKNWWCVLFPPLCLSSSKVEEELAVAGYSSEQIKVFKKDTSSPKYTVRFKILEMLFGVSEN